MDQSGRLTGVRGIYILASSFHGRLVPRQLLSAVVSWRIPSSRVRSDFFDANRDLWFDVLDSGKKMEINTIKYAAVALGLSLLSQQASALSTLELCGEVRSTIFRNI